MEFLTSLFEAALKFILLGGVAIGGIYLGKTVRERKEQKKA